MSKKLWFGFWLAVSALMLLILLPMAVAAGNPLGYIILGGIFWAYIAYVCFNKLRALSETKSS